MLSKKYFATFIMNDIYQLFKPFNHIVIVYSSLKIYSNEL